MNFFSLVYGAISSSIYYTEALNKTQALELKQI